MPDRGLVLVHGFLGQESLASREFLFHTIDQKLLLVHRRSNGLIGNIEPYRCAMGETPSAIR